MNANQLSTAINMLRKAHDAAYIAERATGRRKTGARLAQVNNALDSLSVYDANELRIAGEAGFDIPAVYSATCDEIEKLLANWRS